MNREIKTVKEAWESLLDFWECWYSKYGSNVRSLLEADGEVSGLMKEEGLSPNGLRGLVDPRNVIDSDDIEEISKYLKYLVHGEDLEWIKIHFPCVLVDMASWVYSFYDSKGEEITCKQNLLSMPPQPFYGSPLNAKIISVFNNPGYEIEFANDPDPDSRKYSEARKSALEHLERISERGKSDGKRDGYFARWIVEDGYYRNLYLGNSQTRSTHPIKLLYEDDIDRIVEGVFHTDLLPYPSKSGRSYYVKSIFHHVRKMVLQPHTACGSSIIPSMDKMIDLVLSMMVDSCRGGSPRIFIFRSKEKVSFFMSYILLKYNISQDEVSKIESELIVRPNVASCSQFSEGNIDLTNSSVFK